MAIQDKSLRRLEHYKFHEAHHSQFMQTHDGTQRNSSTNTHLAMSSEALSLEQLLHLKGDQSGHHRASNSSKSEVKRSSPTLQVFPTGTTLTSVDGLPVLKRKRGRPPKNRATEVSLSKQIASLISDSCLPVDADQQPKHACLERQSERSFHTFGANVNL